MTPFYEDPWLTVYGGDCRAVLREMEPESVHCVVTSPPYWGLRDYGTPGQLGLEPTPDEYVAALVDVFREVRRVLRADGTLWINLGDSYGHGTDAKREPSRTSVKVSAAQHTAQGGRHGGMAKQLVGIPWRVAFALQADGWYLRSEIIWAKPNPMPESVQGSGWVRHRVTMVEHENLSRLRNARVGFAPDWPSDVSELPPGEVSRREAALPAERQREDHGASAGGTAGRPRDEAPVLGLGTGTGEPAEVRRDGQGQGNRAAFQRSLPDDGARQGSRSYATPDDEGRSGSAGATPDREQTIPSDVCGTGNEEARVRDAEARDRLDNRSADSRGVAGHLGGAQPSVPLLRDVGEDDGGPCDPAESRGTALAVERGPGVPAVQLEEGQSDRLVDCPGCPKCEANDGLVLRMAAGRPTKAHEQLFLLTKSPSYHYDADAIRETSDWGRENNPDWQTQRAETNARKHPTNRNAQSGGFSEWQPEQGRNRRSVWTVATAPYPGAHFATFPPKLIEPAILAGCPQQTCSECGAPWERMTRAETREPDYRRGNRPETVHAVHGDSGTRTLGMVQAVETTGWRPTCAHDAPTVPGVVLDPFAGTGTVGMVAAKHSRRAVLIDLNPEYLRQCLERNRDIPLGLEIPA